MKILIGAFGPYLNQRENSSQKLLSKIFLPDTKVAKVIFPVNYNKKHFINPIKKFSPRICILIGNWELDVVQLESEAKNKYITLKSPLKRLLVNCWAEILWLFKKNFTVSKIPPKKEFVILPIENGAPRRISLPSVKGVKKTTHSYGEPFVCNFAMYTIQRYITTHNLATKFYFIHIPKRPTRIQQQEVVSLIRKIVHSK